MVSAFQLFSFSAFLCSCTSTSYRIAYDKEGRPVPMLGMQGDVIGETSIRVTALGDVVIEVRNPPVGPFAVATVEEFDRSGTLRMRTQTPLITGIYHSRPNETLWSGISKGIRSLSNLAGTIGSVIFGGQVVTTNPAP